MAYVIVLIFHTFQAKYKRKILVSIISFYIDGGHVESEVLEIDIYGIVM